ncbi:hypothetical protein KC340_g14414 [Hortaea werneckii]|nr:hypothetical protein KC342_g17437 [Hortaea werneckii]KAI7065774.1 hypothetical protein KC339_g15710 [Hortaea werneckii]KAI7298292.1 hypothetical protein KC340_g14414 [Hortaea werneckii]KAI7385853.1 hypothetical protein KC328_g10127 [Hortaea werneckii]KAI7458021.1 hypothetical protein KC351_g18368 [Hortaea werneckii]
MDMFLGKITTTINPLFLYIVALFAAIALLLTGIRTYTTWTYYRTLRQFTHQPPYATGKQTVTPPQIPYTLPFLGNSLDFLAPYPGQYWNKLFSFHPRSTGICTLLVGGRKTHILFSPPAIRDLFKARTASRDVFERDLFSKVFELPDQQIRNAEHGKHLEAEMNARFLIKRERVDELTAQFTAFLDQALGQQDSAESAAGGNVVNLYDWLRDSMFTASTRALMGDHLLQMYPGYREDFYKFDTRFLSFFFGLPRFLMGDAFEVRDRIFRNLERWSLEMHRLSGGEPVDPEGPAWEPFLGSRLNRARQLNYKDRHLNTRTGAALDLGMTFALASNAIPATGWMLMHILTPTASPNLLPRVLTELRNSLKADGQTLDVPTLMAQPLLQSIWTETLRLYADVLVTRNLSEDLILPLDKDGKRTVTLKKGDNVFAPSWLGHHDPVAWGSPADNDNEKKTNPPSYADFNAERFLTVDPETGKETFSLGGGGGTTGKFFPFGGGKTICPGRVFAKQEAVGALAMVLLKFEFEVVGFVDEKGNATQQFPGFAKAFAGSGALAPGGDLRVRMRARRRGFDGRRGIVGREGE